MRGRIFALLALIGLAFAAPAPRSGYSPTTA